VVNWQGVAVIAAIDVVLANRNIGKPLLEDVVRVY
jgi:hypothetical protein